MRYRDCSWVILPLPEIQYCDSTLYGSDHSAVHLGARRVYIIPIVQCSATEQLYAFLMFSLNNGKRGFKFHGFLLMFQYFPKHWGMDEFLKLISAYWNRDSSGFDSTISLVVSLFNSPQTIAAVATVINTDIIIIITFLSNITISTQQHCLSSILAAFCLSVSPPQTQFPSI